MIEDAGSFPVLVSERRGGWILGRELRAALWRCRRQDPHLGAPTKGRRAGELVLWVPAAPPDSDSESELPPTSVEVPGSASLGPVPSSPSSKNHESD